MVQLNEAGAVEDGRGLGSRGSQARPGGVCWEGVFKASSGLAQDFRFLGFKAGLFMGTTVEGKVEGLRGASPYGRSFHRLHW